jgi:hypothetical protein
MNTCEWGGCSDAAAPGMSTGYRLCPFHTAKAYATLRAAEDAAERVHVMQVSNLPIEVDTVEPKRSRPLGHKVPPIVFAIVVLCTVAFPFRWPLSHVALMFIMFLVLVGWWGWIWGFGKSSRT